MRLLEITGTKTAAMRAYARIHVNDTKTGEEKMNNEFIQSEFQVHMLNDEGRKSAIELAEKFSELLAYCRHIGKPGRELALVATKLEEACFFAKKAMASKDDNQMKKIAE